ISQCLFWRQAMESSKPADTLTDEQVLDKAIKEGKTIPGWMDAAGREINSIVHAEVSPTGFDYYPGFSRMAFVIFKHHPEQSEAYEQSAATITALSDALIFYMTICGNTAYSVTRESAKEAYVRGSAALAQA